MNEVPPFSLHGPPYPGHIDFFAQFDHLKFTRMFLFDIGFDTWHLLTQILGQHGGGFFQIQTLNEFQVAHVV